MLDSCTSLTPSKLIQDTFFDLFAKGKRHFSSSGRNFVIRGMTKRSVRTAVTSELFTVQQVHNKSQIQSLTG